MYSLDTNLVEWLPDFYATILDYREICAVETQEFKSLEIFINNVLNNFFPQSMDAGALTEWETALGIPTSDTDGIEFRRKRLLNRISARPPFTLKYLKQKLNELFGDDPYTVSVDYDNYKLNISRFEYLANMETEINQTVRGITPAHIVIVTTIIPRPPTAGHSGTMTSISGITRGGIIA